MSENSLTIRDNRTGKDYVVPIENETIRAMDLRKIKVNPEDFGLMTYDPAFLNTASCKSKITFIDGDKGILEYRGYPIEQLAEKSSFLEVSWLLWNGELPTTSELAEFTRHVTMHTYLHENIKKLMEGFRHDAHPMGMLQSTVGALSTFYPEAKQIHDDAQARAPYDPPPREDADDRRVRLPALDRLPLRLPRQRALVRRQLPLDAPEDVRAEVQGEPGPRARARRPLHPPRRPRAELLDERDARDRLRAAPTRTPASRAPSPRSTARSTAARTRPSSRCCARSATSRTSRPS